MVNSSSLFAPVKLGLIAPDHRIALAPLTRCRASKEHVHGELAVEYYAQRASVPGTFLITEATYIAERASGFGHAPGIWNDQQIAAWKRVTDAVHAKGSFIYCQLWALGRAAFRKDLAPQFDVVSSGNLELYGNTPRPLTVSEIDEYVETYKQAARNAIAAGFDGCEVHSANGYLLDQFLQKNSNNRDDEYGGAAKNRIRFTTRVVQAVAETIGANRTAVRISPYERFQGMGMAQKDIYETFGLLVRTLAPLGLAYLHVTEPRVSGQLQAAADDGYGVPENIDWIAGLWTGRPEATKQLQMKVGVLPSVPGVAAPTNVIIVAGGYTQELAKARALDFERKGIPFLIAFGRLFIANPDLPARLLKDVPLNTPLRATFYTREAAEGYIDYPFADAPALL